jgi:cholesterol oxidase
VNYDAVIVGSGFGGAVAACRLAHAGRSVLVLERGRRWAPQDYPREPTDAWIWEQSRPERNNGWIDLRFLNNMWVAQGAGVGGGSLIYANISIDAKPTEFDAGWPSQISYEVLKPYYERVADMLGSRPLPDGQLTRRFKLMQEAANKTGHGDRFRKLDLAVTFDDDWSYELPDATDAKHSKPWTNRFGKAQGTCVHCGNCDIGCEVQAKNTLDLNYLADAERSGAIIEPLSLVTHVAPVDGGWRVHYDRVDGGRRRPANVVAKRVVLAASAEFEPPPWPQLELERRLSDAGNLPGAQDRSDHRPDHNLRDRFSGRQRRRRTVFRRRWRIPRYAAKLRRCRAEARR